MRLAKQMLAFVRASWGMAGATLLCLAAMESCARVVLGAGIVPDRFDRSRFDERVLYGDEPPDWLEAYRRELAQAWAVRWEPYVYWVMREFEGDHIAIDRRGLRGTWQPPPPPPPNDTDSDSQPLRIFVFGGSTAWGRGARDDFSIPSLLAKQLEGHVAVPISVSNYGQSGWVSTQERIALALEIQRGNVPDLVVFYDGVNDVFSAYQSGEVGIPQNEIKRRVDFEAFEVALLSRVADRSALARLARRFAARDPLGLPSARTDAERRALADAVIDAYLGNLRVVAALADEFEFAALHFWQPVLWSKTPSTPLELEISEAFGLLRPLYEATYARVRERADLRAHPGFHDIQDALDGQDAPSFFDYCHVGEDANAVIAGRITDQVETQLAVLASRKRGRIHATSTSD